MHKLLQQECSKKLARRKDCIYSGKGASLVDATNVPMHSRCIHRIAKSAPFGLDIASSHSLANMDSEHFKLSRMRMGSFIDAVDAEVSVHIHAFPVFDVS